MSGSLIISYLIGPTRKILVTGSIPTDNLPAKKHGDPKPTPRRTLVRKNVDDIRHLLLHRVNLQLHHHCIVASRA